MRMKEKLIALMEKYKSQGLVKGSHLLLPPKNALKLVAELERLNVVVLGVDGWYYVRPDDPKWLAEDRTLDMYIGDDVLHGDSPVHEGAAKVKDFIENHLHETTPFVDLTLDIPVEWDILQIQNESS